MLTAMMLPFAANAATYTVAGVPEILNGDATWAPSNEANDMTTEDGVNYTLTVTGLDLEAGSYEFKVVEDHSWTNSWPSANYVLTIAETAKYDIVYTFNADTKAVNATPTKVGEFGGTITEKTYTVAGVDAVLGSVWDPTDSNNDMVKGDDGIFRLVKENVALEANKPYEYKVVQNHSWDHNWPNQNASFTVSEAGNYNVTFTFNEESKEVGATTEAIVEVNVNPVLFDFQNNNGNWTIGEGADYAKGELTEDNPITMGGVTLTCIKGTSTNAVRYYTNASKGNCLWLFKNTSIKLSAPEGKSIVKIEFTMQAGSFDLTPSTGEVTENVWTGKAVDVTFGPNAKGTRYVHAIAVTLENGVPEPEPVYTVAGAFNNGNGDDPIFGKTWDVTLEANDMVKGDDGIYTLTLSNVELTTAGNILYKVVKNHSWDMNWGFPEKENGNADYYVALPDNTEKATCNIIFKFNPEATFENGFHVDCAVEVVSVTTGIQTVNTTNAATVIYSLQGIRLNQLQKGVNIINGKKVIMK